MLKATVRTLKPTAAAKPALVYLSMLIVAF